MNEKEQHCKGFTIIELAIVIAIIAVVFSTIIFATQARMDASRIYTTKSRMQIISDAIDTYARVYGHIPCPADPSVPTTDPNYGWGTGTNTGTCSKAIAIGGSGHSRIVRGMIPVKMLLPELDPQIAVDGWGNRFTYVVTEMYTQVQYFTGVEPFTSQYATEEGAEYAICRDADSACNAATNNMAENNGSTKKGDVAYILFSSGYTGHASYKDRNPSSMQDNALALGTDDRENGDFDDDGNTYIQTMPQAQYQDILIFKNRWQLPKYMNAEF